MLGIHQWVKLIKSLSYRLYSVVSGKLYILLDDKYQGVETEQSRAFGGSKSSDVGTQF